MSTGVDPISFEVIRNALVAATDEMVLALKRSAYSTNIKTRSDFSCAFFDAELRSVAQAFTQPVHLGSMVQQVPYAIERYGAENLGPGDAIVTNDPHPRGVHLNDVSLISPVYVDDLLIGYVANLAHHVDVGGGAPASIGAFQEVFQEGVIIPPVKVVDGRQDRGRRLPAHPRPDPVEARDGRRLPGAGRGQRDRREENHGAVQPPRTRDAPRDDGGAARLHGAARAGGDRAARAGHVRGRGHGRQRRLHRPAGPPPGPDRDHARRPPLRHVGVGSAAAGAGQLDLCDDLLGVRLCAEVPDRPRPAGERRLLPALQPQRAGGNGDELHLALAGRRRLGDAGPPRRGDVPRPPACVPGAAAGRHQGDDVPGGLRLARHGQGELHVLLRGARGWLRRPARKRRPRRGAGPRPEHRERADRGDRAELPRADRPPLARRGLRGAGPVPRRARAPQGLPDAAADDVHDPRRP